MNYLKHFIELIMVILIIFIFPLVWTVQKQDIALQTYVYRQTDKFVDNIQTNGYLSVAAYEGFVSKLNNTNLVYEVDIEHTQTLFEPEYLNGIFTGNVMTYSDTKYTSNVLEELYSSNIYIFDQNDYITVKVNNKTKTFGMRIVDFILKKSHTIYTEKTGKIRDLQLY